MTTRRRGVLIAGAVALALAFGYFVWPTPYQYIPVAPGADLATGLRIVSVRVHRITGETDFLVPQIGWLDARSHVGSGP